MPISPTDLILNPDGSVYHLNLLPRQIADTVIAVGDPNRVGMIAEYLDSIDYEINKREFITITGKFNSRRITVISTGIGTDNVEIVLTELDALVNVDLKTREPKARKKAANHPPRHLRSFARGYCCRKPHDQRVWHWAG